MQQLELDFETPITKAARHAFTIGYRRGARTTATTFTVLRPERKATEHFLKQLEGTREDRSTEY